MTREGNYLWFSDQNYHYIGKTTTGGSLMADFNPNDNTIKDLTWDGTNIWTINTSGTIKKFSPSGALVETISGLLTGGWGLTYDGQYLWASDPGADKIYQISLSEDTAPPGPPSVVCATHPIESVWYSNPDPLFHWTPPADPSGIAGYSYLLDTAAETLPDTTVEGTDTTATYLSLQDGIWYFHCRAQDGAGNWGEASHYKIRIDTTPPVEGTIVIAGGADTTSSLTVSLSDLGAEDEHSGMGQGAAMRFSNDGVSWSEAEPFASSRTDWDLSQYGGNHSSGLKKVYVVFSDVAGNWSALFFDEIVYSAPLRVVTESLAGGTVGFAYAETLSAAGGWPPYEWELVTGALPPGLALDASGVISGDPDSAGTFPFTVRVTDSNMSSATRDLSITILVEAVKGDVNGDGVINVLDLVTVVRYILGLEEFSPLQLWAADVQPDGAINVLDALGIVNIILGMPPAARPTSPGRAVVSIKRDSGSSGERGSFSITLESQVPVAGIQLHIRVTQGSELAGPPQLAPWSQSLQFAHRAEGDRITLLMYSLSNETIPPSESAPIVTLHLGEGAAPVQIENAILADSDGEAIPVEIKAEALSSQAGWALLQNYPNPFNPVTSVQYSVISAQAPTTSSQYSIDSEQSLPRITLKIYNILGEEVRTLVNEPKRPGYYTVTWDGRDRAGAPLPSGVYFCRMEADGRSQTVKMTLTK